MVLHSFSPICFILIGVKIFAAISINVESLVHDWRYSYRKANCISARECRPPVATWVSK
jgi:hypothetical protein